ncbi:MAG: redoxin domain-containing protein [Acidimicrobiia bacterium]|nr:redoxin domain-containing protein [Acidimicrobiia bacterium]
MDRETDPDAQPANPEPADRVGRTRNRAGIAAAISLLILTVTIGLAFLPGTTEPTDRPQPSTPADIEYRSYETTEALLADFAGRPLVVNFFASWCAPCRAELPHFVDAHAEFGERVGFVGIDYQDPDRDAAIALLIETGVTYPIAEDPTGAILEDLSGLPAMPTTIFVAADGSIVERHRGIILIDDLSAMIEDLL